jgi:hypothetical protein
MELLPQSTKTFWCGLVRIGADWCGLLRNTQITITIRMDPPSLAANYGGLGAGGRGWGAGWGVCLGAWSRYIVTNRMDIVFY